MDLPLMTDQFARKLQRVDADFTTLRMEKLRRLPGNPYSVEIQRFNDAVAFTARKLPMVSYFNKVIGLQGDPARGLDEVTEFYGAGPFQFEIIPCDFTWSLGLALSERGFRQTSFHATLYGRPQALNSSREPNGHIDQVVSAEDMRVYVDVNLSAWGVAPQFRDAVGSVMRTSYGHPDFQHYIGYTPAGEPASVATLYIQDGVAYYGNAGTVPDARGSGFQLGLLRRIANDAHRAGCTLIVGMSKFGSTSYRNMERIGMRLGFTQGIWTLR